MMFWVAGVVVFAVLVHVLSGVLLPFVAAMGIAYFLDPVADRLEARKISRGIATSLILLTFFLTATGALMLLLPMLQSQIIVLARMIPAMIEIVRSQVQPFLEDMIAGLPPEVLDNVRDAAAGFAGKAVSWVSSVLANLWSGGVAFFNMLVLYTRLSGHSSCHMRLTRTSYWWRLPALQYFFADIRLRRLCCRWICYFSHE